MLRVYRNVDKYVTYIYLIHNANMYEFHIFYKPNINVILKKNIVNAIKTRRAAFFSPATKNKES